mmetsp:Transcript_8201/g.12343  ORF Transcript_8201/g.12343 Transcript_8201/m.12343 type:complete len:551 (-) Transcript_8201:147-1799(-)
MYESNFSFLLNFVVQSFAIMFDVIDRLLLSPNDLYEKRKDARLNELKRAFEGLSSASQRFVRSKKDVPSDEVQIINMKSVSEIDVLVKGILDKNKATPFILGIKAGVNTGDGNGSSATIELALKSPSSSPIGKGFGCEKIVELPLVEFGLKLADAFENQLTSTTLCFIADASSGLGSDMLGQIVTGCDAGLVLIKEPAWMSMLADSIARKVISDKPTSKNLKKIVFGLCRLAAWEVRNDVGVNRTIVFTLPGQSSTASLLPSLQAAFPCERHVFVYDGCIDSTARALRNIRLKRHGVDDNSIPLSMSRVVGAAIPITPLTSVPKMKTLLKPFSYNQAGAIEAWFSSVDAFLQLKQHEKRTGYTPFVCRLGFLMSQVGRLGNGKVDQSQLALTNVLQYITGSKSRQLNDDVLERARNVLNGVRDADLNDTKQYGGVLSDNDRKAIEAAAFAHKEILIENKTLMDTVQPKVEWSLKAAKKLTSCACCMPGQGDEDEEEDGEGDKEEGTTEEEKSSFSVGEVNKKKRKPVSKGPVYVDGKTTFAFDPTKFMVQ